ncbi:MAG: hypothetical protein HYY62_05370 [Deltaproteobacteria bacterium]|nr:hypothetical protein [Deltaproteobacteria bacterium]
MESNNLKKEKWIKENQEYILKWKEIYEKLYRQSLEEWWSTQRFEQEIGSSLLDSELRDFWFFCGSYIEQHPNGQLAKDLKKALKDLKEFGTLEPSEKRRFLKTMATVRRKKYGK